MAVIRKQSVLSKSGMDIMHPETEVAAIVDLSVKLNDYALKSGVPAEGANKDLSNLSATGNAKFTAIGAPKPQTAAGVGQWGHVQGANATLPAGGTWAWNGINWANNIIYSGVSVGSTNIGGGLYSYFWYWRIA